MRRSFYAKVNKMAEIKTVILRIKKMEHLYDMLSEYSEGTQNEPLTNTELKAAFVTLSSYYTGGDWLHDYELDEKGLIPSDIKRGVLSQDGLYNLLEEIKSPDR